MKNGTFLWSGAALRVAGIAVLALAVMFAACSNPAGGEGSGGNADKTALNAAIETAEAAKAGVLVNTSSTNVALGTYWATQTNLDTFTEAIVTAKTVRDNTSASQPQVDGAVTTLNNAVDAFNAAKQPGTLVLDWSALDAEIAAAKMARDSVIVAVNAAGAASGAKWVTQAQFDDFQDKINNAETLVPTSQAMVNSAKDALTTALTDFNSAVTNNGQGEKTEGFSQTDFDSLKDMANTAKAGVVTSSLNGDDVSPADLWVTSAVMGELNTAITTAPSTVSDTAYQTLLDALNIFNEAKKPGATIDNMTMTALNAAITNANAAKVDVEIAANSSQAPSGSAWVTQAQLDALNMAYQAAANAATKKAVGEATTALNDAISDFNNAKDDNGPGTAVNGVTITGIGAIYNNATTVRVGVAASKDVEAPANPPGLVQGTVTNGTLSVSLGTLPNGSYYVGFSSDGIIYFISKATVPFNGAMVNRAYDTVNFELYTHSVKGSDMDLDQTVSLNDIIQGMSGGELTAYDTAFKNFLRQEVSKMLGSGYTNLSFLDVALYTDEACTQEFSGSDQVGPDTPIYTKFSLVALMEGGEGEYQPTGKSINITGVSGISGTYRIFLSLTNNPSDQPVAGTQKGTIGSSLTAPLYAPEGNLANGNYWVFIVVNPDAPIVKLYRSKAAESFSGTTTTIPFSRFEPYSGAPPSSSGFPLTITDIPSEVEEVQYFLELYPTSSSQDQPVALGGGMNSGTFTSITATVYPNSPSFDAYTPYYVYISVYVGDQLQGPFVSTKTVTLGNNNATLSYDDFPGWSFISQE
jgi:hypothetical protein